MESVIKQEYQESMTQLLEEFIVQGLRGSSSVPVCSVCQREGNNTDCGSCYLGKF